MKPAANSEYAESKTFRISPTLTVEITIGLNNISCEWDPDIPKQLTEEELFTYWEARHEMLVRLSALRGSPVLMVFS